MTRTRALPAGVAVLAATVLLGPAHAGATPLPPNIKPVTSQASMPYNGTVYDSTTGEAVALTSTLHVVTKNSGSNLDVHVNVASGSGTGQTTGSAYTVNGASDISTPNPPQIMPVSAQVKLLPGNPISPGQANGQPSPPNIIPAGLVLSFSPTGQLTSAVAHTPSLWLGEDDDPGRVTQTDTAGNVVSQGSDVVGGIASSGTDLYFSDGNGVITKRALDGTTVEATIPTPVHGIPVDMAWDSKRATLWRAQVYPPMLYQLDPSSGAELSSIALPATDADPAFTAREAIGVAYDPGRDLLYVSYNSPDTTSAHGLIDTINPATGADTELFRTTSYNTYGLAYDQSSDSLWVGDVDAARNVTLSGSVISSFARPRGGGIDGVELVP